MSNNPSSAIEIAGAEARVLSEKDLMQLSCGVQGCGSNCCKAGAPVILNPYEIALICRDRKMSYEDLLDIVDTERANGFPLVMLPRDPVCRFWTDAGCGIYTARPLACRLFPIGRVFDGIQSRLVLPGRNICDGLEHAPALTVADYLKTQDTALHFTMADRWIEFVNEMELLPLPDKPVTSVAFHMLVYSPDTPAAAGPSAPAASLEDRYLLRLATARQKLPAFLRSARL